jgi:hypothetical protein
MKNLERLVAAYSAMDQRRKDESLIYMEKLAAAFPGRAPAQLFLVGGNAQKSNSRH